MAESSAKAVRLAKEGSKERALVCMRHKKTLQKQLDKLDGQEIQLNELIGGIEAAKEDINVM